MGNTQEKEARAEQVMVQLRSTWGHPSVEAWTCTELCLVRLVYMYA